MRERGGGFDRAGPGRRQRLAARGGSVAERTRPRESGPGPGPSPSAPGPPAPGPPASGPPAPAPPAPTAAAASAGHSDGRGSRRIGLRRARVRRGSARRASGCRARSAGASGADRRPRQRSQGAVPATPIAGCPAVSRARIHCRPCRSHAGRPPRVPSGPFCHAARASTECRGHAPRGLAHTLCRRTECHTGAAAPGVPAHVVRPRPRALPHGAVPICNGAGPATALPAVARRRRPAVMTLRARPATGPYTLSRAASLSCSGC